MSETNICAYGDASVEIYDQIIVCATDPACVAFLRRFAGSGARALELGTGTGRVAIPLLSDGVIVDGIEPSAKMIALMRHKEELAGNARRIEIVGSDMSRFDANAQYDLVFVLKHTLFLAPTRDAQQDVLRNVARSLKRNGVFVFEGIVPDPSRYDRGQCVRTSIVRSDAVCIEASIYDPTHQTLSSTEIYFYGGRIYLVPIMARYIWPAELDQMAAAAGLELKERYATWAGDAFEPGSHNNISVYVKTGEYAAA